MSQHSGRLAPQLMTASQAARVAKKPDWKITGLNLSCVTLSEQFDSLEHYFTSCLCHPLTWVSLSHGYISTGNNSDIYCMKGKLAPDPNEPSVKIP
eukprot:583935-Rhodomonas_salina.1